MPASDPHINHRNLSPKAEAPYRGRNTAVTEYGTGKQSRKRGKNAIHRDTTPSKEADSTVQSELGGSPTPARVENDAAGVASKHPSTRNDPNTSAVLDALASAEKVSDAAGSDVTGAWAQPIPFLKSSPMDLLEGINVGGSPPAVGNPVERGGFSSKTPPSSPRTRKSRPVSYSAAISPSQARQSLSERSSRIPRLPFGDSSPPPPHLPQPHFYAVPDVDLGLGARLSQAETDGEARFLSFAELPSTNSRRQKCRLDAVLLGSEDRLDVAAVEKDNLIAAGTIEGIRGTVVDAKILTWQSGTDPFHDIRPLVSLVVHGPKLRTHASQATADLAPDRDQNATATNAVGLLPARAGESIDFQTTVEVYSLATQEHLATLVWSQPTSGLSNIRGLPVSAPPPVGSLKLDARGNFLTVSSGYTGEIFVFTVDNDSSAKFRCIGKFWTSVQTLHDRRYSNSSNSTDPDGSPADVNRGNNFAQLPIMSLSSRWLAVVPPGPISCQALPITIAQSLIPTAVTGLESRNAPPRPPVSCTVESPDAESFINRVARGVAQEVVKGARWLGGQGLQTWNNYWNKDQRMNAQSPSYSRNLYQGDPHLPAGVFPPTHAPEIRPSSAEPQLVSIIDLKLLARQSSGINSDTVTPPPTFQPPNGVSFLSFMPDGLAIVSVSTKGDIQYVWDLKQIRHLRAGTLLNSSDSEMSPRSSKVIQIARFARLTPSSVIDIEWKCPSGDRFAVITRNGTIHLFDLPLLASQWPPTRRSLRVEPSSAPASPAVTAQPDEPTVVGGVFSSAMRLAGKTQPVLANLRGRAPSFGVSNVVGRGNSGIGFASTTSMPASKAVAAGLSKSVGAATGTVSSLRHAGDNRLHLNSLARNPMRSRVCWSRHREQTELLIIDAQSIKSFRVSRRRASSKPRRQPLSVIDANPRLSLPLPALGQMFPVGATSTAVLHHDSGGGEEPAAPHWALRPPSRSKQPSRVVHPLSCAEIETNAPYQPFHSDRRVNLFVYNDGSRRVGASDAHDPWVFGDEIAATSLDLGLCPPTVSDGEDQNSGASVLYRHTSVTNGETIGSDEVGSEQIVVTTRRRKNKGPHQSVLAAGVKLDDDDGFFEDDCDVLDFAEDRV